MKRRGKQEPHFAVCINNKGYEASLETGKLYRTAPDDEAASHSSIRVVDESGVDYGYSVSRFFPIDVPQALEKALASATGLVSEDMLQVRAARGGESREVRTGSFKVRKTKLRAADRV